MNLDRRKTRLSELLPLLILAATLAFYLRLSWRRFPVILRDQGWFLQVSQRIAQGEVLYRDVLWAYGPLPVLIMGWLGQHGNVKIVYYSLLNGAIAAIVTVVLYRLHRYRLSPLGAALGVLTILVGFAGYNAFVLTYTPGRSLGALSMLLTLLGIIECLGHHRRCNYGSVLIGLGLTGSLLTKPEFGFGSLVLIFLTIGVSSVVRTAANDDGVLSRKKVLAAVLTSLILTAAVYWHLGTRAGWGPMLAGIAGYDQLPVLGLRLLGYGGPISWVQVSSAALLTAAMALLVLWPTCRSESNLTLRRLVALLALVLALGDGLFLVAWYSGLVSAVRQGSLSTLESASILDKAISIWPGLSFRLLKELIRPVFLSTGILFAILLPRWMRRLRRRESVTRQQLILLIVLTYTLVVELRFMPFGSGWYWYRTTGFVLLVALLPAEFPQFRPSQVGCVKFNSSVLLGTVLLFCGIGILRDWQYYSAFNSPIDTAHGRTLVRAETQSFLIEAVQYIEENSQPDDYIAVFGRLPGLFYLSGRRNACKQDYLMPGLGDSESDGYDCLSELVRFRPAVVLIPQGKENFGLLSFQGDREVSRLVLATGRWVFGSAATEIEHYILDNYQLDRVLGHGADFKLAAFRRLSKR